jgi:hypothetical protein
MRNALHRRVTVTGLRRDHLDGLILNRGRVVVVDGNG